MRISMTTGADDVTKPFGPASCAKRSRPAQQAVGAGQPQALAVDGRCRR
jgi:hypothetical protein